MAKGIGGMKCFRWIRSLIHRRLNGDGVEYYATSVDRIRTIV